jgi:hypothetical protein
MASGNFKPGDVVTVVTVGRGLAVARARAHAKLHAKVTWRGVIVGPSMVGNGWWNVRSIARGGRVYAVPDVEIRKTKK